MNEQFETQNPVENTVTPANQMETPTPEAPKKKGNKIAIIAGVVAAVVVAGGVGVFAAVKTGAFLSPSKKVLLAGAKTVSDMGSLGETLKDCVSLYSDEYTLKMDISMNEGDISMEGRSSNEQKQIKGNLNISGAPSIDFLADIGADSVQVEVPTISERLFTYDYRNEKSGYLLEMVDQDTLDAVDATLKAAYDNQNSDEFRKKMLKVYADEYNTLEFSKVEEMFFAAGKEKLNLRNVEMILHGQETVKETDHDDDIIRKSRASSVASGAKSGILVVGTEGLLTQMAKCCKPAPPDPIIGFVTRGKGVSIHRKDCKNFLEMERKTPERVIQTTWGTPEPDTVYPVDIYVLAGDRQGLLRDISDVFMREKINVVGVCTQSSKGQARRSFTVEIVSTDSLNKAMQMIGEVGGVMQVKRH